MKDVVHNAESAEQTPSPLFGDFRTHASRTMMLSELKLLLDAVPAEGSSEDYRRAVLDENVLLKGAATTRAKSLRHLREL